MLTLVLSPLVAQPDKGGSALDPGFFTILGVVLLVLGFLALRRAVQPVRELLTAVAAAGLALIFTMAAMAVLVVALTMDIT